MPSAPWSRPTRAALALIAALGSAGCGSSPATDPCAEAPTFGRDLYPSIVEPKCLPCHSTSRMGTARQGAPEGLDFDTWALVEPNRSAFADAITSGREPPASSGLATTAAERERVKAWRTCGYPR